MASKVARRRLFVNYIYHLVNLEGVPMPRSSGGPPKKGGDYPPGRARRGAGTGLPRKGPFPSPLILSLRARRGDASLGEGLGRRLQTPGTAGAGCRGEAGRDEGMFTEGNEENEGLTRDGRVGASGDWKSECRRRGVSGRYLRWSRPSAEHLATTQRRLSLAMRL